MTGPPRGLTPGRSARPDERFAYFMKYALIAHAVPGDWLKDSVCGDAGSARICYLELHLADPVAPAHALAGQRRRPWWR